MKPSIRAYTALFVIAGLAFLILAARAPLWAQEGASPDDTAAPEWLEPRGLNVVDLVGQVPEEHLKDSVLIYETGRGILQYQSGQRNGDRVEITVKITPRYFEYGGNTFTKFGCLGQTAVYDQIPSTAPASTMRLFDDGQEITANIENMSVIPAGQVLPTNNANGYLRYPEPGATPATIENGSLVIPANMGCTIIVPGRLDGLTATFTLTTPQVVNVAPLSSETFTAHSYIGIGGAGILASLNSQMLGRFGERGGNFTLSIPQEADYAFVNFPPTPVDPYAGEDPINRPLPGSGTYRFSNGSGFLSVDHVASAGFPILGQWRDSDQTGNSRYLTYFEDTRKLGIMEYFLPPGIAYDPCMTDGGCPDALLDAIHAARYPMTIYYYKVERIVAEGLERIPLKMVGKGWSATNPWLASPGDTIPPGGTIPPPGDSTVYLPLVTTAPGPSAPIPPDDPTDCPCGWFDALGRMVDFIRKP